MSNPDSKALSPDDLRRLLRLGARLGDLLSEPLEPIVQSDEWRRDVDAVLAELASYGPKAMPGQPAIDAAELVKMREELEAGRRHQVR
jgi:hypothetical protein